MELGPRGVSSRVTYGGGTHGVIHVRGETTHTLYHLSFDYLPPTRGSARSSESETLGEAGLLAYTK